MDVWGHYGTFSHDMIFVYVMLAWNLMALDAIQQISKLKKKRKEKSEWTL